MGVRAKFKVDSVVDTQYSEQITLSPVYGDTEENKRFWEYTPSGGITLHITNPEARGTFQRGAEFYVDFTPAPLPGQQIS